MKSPIYTITVQVDDGEVAVCVAFASGTEQSDMHYVLHRIAGAFARVEGIDHRMMSKLLFESRETMEEDGIKGYIVSRYFEDPAYPERLKQGLAAIGMMNVSELPKLN